MASEAATIAAAVLSGGGLVKVLDHILTRGDSQTKLAIEKESAAIEHLERSLEAIAKVNRQLSAANEAQALRIAALEDELAELRKLIGESHGKIRD